MHPDLARRLAGHDQGEDLGQDQAVMAVGHRLRWLGLSVVFAPSRSRRTQRAVSGLDEARVDLLVSGRRITVQRTEYHFTGPHDFPGEEAIFDLASAFDGMVRKPDAYLLLDLTWLGIMALPAGAYPTRIYREPGVYACPVQHNFLSMGQFYALASLWERELHTRSTYRGDPD